MDPAQKPKEKPMTRYMLERGTLSGAATVFLTNATKCESWNANADYAALMDLEEAQREQSQWEDHAAMKGTGYLYNIVEVETDEPEGESINLIPNWKAAAQIYIMALENGTAEGKHSAKTGIMEMADKFDRYIKQQKGGA